LFEYAHRYYGEEDSVPVSFDEDGAYLPYPQSKLGASDSTAYHVVDFDIPFFKPTRSKGLQQYLGFGDAERISRTGVSVLLGGYAPTHDNLYMRLIDHLEGIRCIASDRGLIARASDKGKMATQLFNLMGSIHEVRFLTGANVISFLQTCVAIRHSKKSMNQTLGDAPPLDYDGISRNLKSQYTNHDFVTSFVRWMLRRRLLRAGIVARCNHCYSRQFALIDSVRHKLRCQGCRSFIEIPQDDYRHLKLHYVPNSLLVNAVGQGYLPHLLALYFLAVNSHGGRSYRNLTFFCPGVEVIRKKSLLGELDFVLLFDGEVIAGECKQGTQLNQHGLTKTINLSKSIGADVVAFCTTENFSKRTIREIEKIGYKKGIRTAILDGRSLTNQSVDRWIWRERARRGDKQIQPDLKLFCDDVVRSLSREE
jgi:hypothetical protein